MRDMTNAEAIEQLQFILEHDFYFHPMLVRATAHAIKVLRKDSESDVFETNLNEIRQNG